MQDIYRLYRWEWVFHVSTPVTSEEDEEAALLALHEVAEEQLVGRVHYQHLRWVIFLDSGGRTCKLEKRIPNLRGEFTERQQAIDYATAQGWYDCTSVVERHSTADNQLRSYGTVMLADPEEFAPVTRATA